MLHIPIIKAKLKKVSNPSILLAGPGQVVGFLLYESRNQGNIAVRLSPTPCLRGSPLTAYEQTTRAVSEPDVVEWSVGREGCACHGEEP